MTRARRSRSRAAPGGIVRSSNPPGGRGRRAWPAIWLRRASSSPGTDAQARTRGSCDQLVIDSQRPLLDDDLVLAATALAQRPSVLESGDRLVLRKAALVPARELAAVQRNRHDLPLADAHLDATADQ